MNFDQNTPKTKLNFLSSKEVTDSLLRTKLSPKPKFEDSPVDFIQKMSPETKCNLDLVPKKETPKISINVPKPEWGFQFNEEKLNVTMNGSQTTNLQNGKPIAPNDYQLTNNDFEIAYKLHVQHKNWAYPVLQEQLSYRIGKPQIKQIDGNEFKSKCQLAFSIYRGKEKQSELNMNDVDLYTKQAEFLSRPRNVMSHHVPGEISCEGPWSEIQTNLLLNVLLNIDAGEFRTQNGGIDWSGVSRFVPGRTGEQCQQKYYELKREGKLNDLKFETYNFSPQCQLQQMPALDEEEEWTLYEKISQEIENHLVVTKSRIAEVALDIYYQPVSLVRKALIKHFSGKELLDNSHNVKEEYIEEYDKTFKELMEIANNEPQLIIERYQIKNFTASMSWVCGFMKRFDLVFKCAHYERRGAIEENWVDCFLTQVAKAIAHYGVDKVLNMDETHVMIDNFSNKVISHKGQKSITMYSNHCNETDGFTAIATCSATQKYPLIVVAKGKTDRCTAKFKIGGNVHCNFFQSSNGWTNVSIMEQYLKWISFVMKAERFALIVDCFKAHINEKVKKLAENLGIELIIVPACGTGIYQPLDRKIFGIVKAKLRSAENQKSIRELKDEQSRYNIICQQMEKAWKEVSYKALQSAWDIPGLNTLMKFGEEKQETHDEEFIPQ